MRIFLDSGAFSVWNRGETIDLNAYIVFCKKYQEHLDLIASLDVMPGTSKINPTIEQTKIASTQGYFNYQKMIRAKIDFNKVLHTFHQNDPLDLLEKFVREIPYLGISPRIGKSSTQRESWLKTECMPILLDSKGIPKVRFHGFAVTALKLTLNYPWFSVDSSSWRLRGGGYGLLDLPIDPYHPDRLESCYVNSVPIGTGVGKHTKNDGIAGLFDVPKISQSDVSFSSPKYKHAIEELLAKYHFNLKELEEDAYLRAAWNAIYMMTTIKKFSNVTLYLATNDFKSLQILISKMKENNMSTKDLNVLISFAFITSRKDPDKANNLDKLIQLKKTNE